MRGKKNYSIFKPLYLISIQEEKALLKLNNIRPDDNISELLKEDLNKGFRFLVEKYSSKLYWHIRRLVIIHEDADDALQNTFMNAWRSIENFRGDSSYYTWLYSIATNEALTLINKRKRNDSVAMVDLESYFANSQEGSTWFDGDDAQMKLQNAIIQLPEKQRIVFNLKYYDEMTYEEMSKVLKTSEGALKASYHHAVKKIEKTILRD
jgi:RNA polymerase sigma factor (sigma-70 family)